MNQHTSRPACHLETEPQDRDSGFRDNARWCYTTDAEIERLTPGCKGCTRRKPG